MKISLNWLKEYVKLPKEVTPDKILYDLTMSTVEVEGFEDTSISLDKMYIGVVKEILKHPDADQLKIAKTDLGEEFGVKEIVCGGSNLYEGMATIVAIPGAKVHWHGEDKVTKIKLSKIRGVESFGMICASEEIGLANIFPANDDKEVIDLEDDKTTPGMEASEYLGFNDFIFDIDNKSLTNRPDLWGHYGIARELSAIYNCPLKELGTDFSFDSVKEDSNIEINIENSSNCQRFFITSIDNVEVKKSPLWLKTKLGLIGQKSINNIVDVTNYVMFSLGKPTHAFDADVTGSKFEIRNAKNKEFLTLLDETKLELKETDLVLSNGKELIGLAGIMGGLKSGVSNSTKKLYLESANFSKSIIRKTMQTHDLRSDAGIRFEKGLSTDSTPLSQILLIETLKKILPNIEVIGFKDNLKEETKNSYIEVNHNFIISRIGQEVSEEKIRSILESLGFCLEIENQTYKITAPKNRSTGDVGIPEDIVEEVARIIGYDNLKPKSIPVTLEKAIFQKDKIIEKEARNYLVNALNSQELVSYPWMNEKTSKPLEVLTNTSILNDPPSPEEALVRTSLLPNLISFIEGNLRYFNNFSLFELGRVFNNKKSETFSTDSENIPSQDKELCVVEVNKSSEIAFFELKEKITKLLNQLKIEFSFKLLTESKYSFSDNKAILSIISNKTEIGELSLLNFKTLKELGLKSNAISFAIIDFEKLLSLKTKEIKYKPIPKFPAIDFELTIVLDNSKTWEELQEIVKRSDKLIKKVKFLDLYQGEQITAGSKALSFRMTLLDENKTLTAKNAEKVAQKVLGNIKDGLAGVLRV